jgi:4-amino-4-deoxy-L-arabinose transferase-like glycosyltransferase
MTAIDESLRGRIAYDGARTPLKTGLFLLVCAAWLLPGLVGHDPWKYDEAVAFGVVSEMLRSGDWLSFRIAGETFADRAPLFMWIAALFAKGLGGILAVHDAARLASGLFMACTIALLSAASYELMGERALRMSVLIFLGSLGLLLRAHEMTPDLAGLTGVALALYGVVLTARRALAGGAAMGAGIGVAFLGNGFLPVGMIVSLLLLLPAVSPFWRTRAHAKAVGIAIVVALPILALWPLAAWMRAPGAFQLWMQGALSSRWDDPAGPNPLDILYFARLLPWYAWPAWPLAAWTLWRARRTFRERRELLLPLAAFAAFFLVTSIFADARDVNALALLLPLALLGAAELDTVPRGAASALDWFGMTTFFLFAAMVWACWIAAITGKPQVAADWLAREVPGFKYHFSFIAFALASLLTLIWIVVVARSLRSTRRAIVNWTAGITMAWMLVMTLGVPLVDQARSYRALAARVVPQLPGQFRCIARKNVGDAQRALLDYFANIRTVRDDIPAAARCEVLLVQASPLRVPEVGSRWTEIWRGSRPGDRNELFIVYRKL